MCHLMDNAQPNRHVRFIMLGLVLLTAAIYSGVIQHEFITFDDPDYVTQNPHVQNGLSWQGVGWAFTTGHASNWHPLTWLSHMLDWELFGDWAGGHHLTSLLLHLINTGLLFAALHRMTGSTWRSAAVAALFAWHPLHIESVAWVAERKDVLCAFFWMLGLLAYTSYARQPTWRRYVITLVCFAAGLLSKPMMVTFPCVLLLLDLWPLNRFRLIHSPPAEAEKLNPAPSWPRLLLEKLPFFLLTVGASLVTFRVQRGTGAVISLDLLPLTQRLQNAVVALAGYLRKTIWPHDLAVFYPHAHSFSVGLVAGALILLAAITVVAAMFWRRQAYLLVGWLWFLGTLFPVIGIVQVGAQGMADRYTYIPLIGVFIALVWGATSLVSRWPTVRMPLQSAAAVALAGCLVVTVLQVRTWQNSYRLFSHALSVTPDNFLSRDNLGTALDKLGRSEEAVENFKRSAQLEPRAPYSFNNLGWHYERAGDLAKAMEYYQTTLRIQPNFFLGHYNVARLLTTQGRLEEATQHYQECLRLDPHDPGVHYLLGAVLVQLNQADAALQHFKAALRNKPNYPEVESQIGSLYQKFGQNEAASQHYLRAISFNPNYVAPRVRLGLLLARHGQFAEAQAHLIRATQLEPTNDAAFYNLAGVYEAQALLPQAAAAFAKVVELRPTDVDARARLGLVLANTGAFETALTHLQAALRVQPDSAPALGGLALLRATNPQAVQRDVPEAIRLAERACELTRRMDPTLLAILDQVYAEAGRFAEAIQVAEAVRTLAGNAGQTNITAQATKRLEAYRAGKPYRG